MKILIVEDEKRLAGYLVRAFAEEGYATESIENGKDALSFVENFHDELDCIVLDILLPGMLGIAVCKAIRKKHIDVPILMLTAKDSEAEKIEGLDSGADDYLTKPFLIKELLARVRSLIRRKSGEFDHVFTAGEITMETQSRKVFLSNKEILLTPKEYELLKLLLSHQNHVLNREVILDKVWGMTLDTFSNVVDVHISSLRKKIHDTKIPHVIESVRGVGYRFNTN